MALYDKSMDTPNFIPERNVNVGTEFHGNPFSSCCVKYISVETAWFKWATLQSCCLILLQVISL